MGKGNFVMPVILLLGVFYLYFDLKLYFTRLFKHLAVSTSHSKADH